ncbi:tonB-system energizer ExbB [Chelatococcus asaccharovorans]|uniref:Biopolymer transport protein ExbB n=1 Tax=Chelatococcus asaccharovorans TaxID=28210 RepID=A0A2V3U6I9_9HYPH|nr:tonB-system energizer ExbB [Chelatococcus asaccharovorans]PXW58843.1 outer membrane transport energization protein ExbB [Chelatococcus asaccharovorans]
MPAIHGLTPLHHSRSPDAAGVVKRMAMISRWTMMPRPDRFARGGAVARTGLARAILASAIWLAAASLSPLAAQQPLRAQEDRPGTPSNPLPQGHPAVGPSPLGQNPVAMPPAAATAAPQVYAPSQGQSVPTGQAPASPAQTSASVSAPTGEAALPEQRILEGATTAGLPHDLSPWGMFMQADVVVKAVMIGLAFASLATWTVWLAKSIEIAAAKRRVRRSLGGLIAARSLDEAEDRLRSAQLGKDVVAALVQAAKQEDDVSADLPADGIKERASASLSRIEARAGRLMTRGTGLLATIGATAPFVGLFGTVWGIMNSFIGIARSNTTNLAVVAPGIAEALLATAIGLVAAIPAVIIYNVFARSITGYRALLADAGTEVMRHLSRDLDRRAAAPHRRKPSLFAAAE